MAAVYEGGAISLWDTSDWNLVQTLEGKGADVLAFSTEEPTLLSAGAGAPVSRWEVPGGEARHVYPFSEIFEIANIGNSIDISPDGTTLAAGGRGGNVTLFDLQTLQPLRTLNIQAKSRTYVSFSPDGKTLAGSAEGKILLWDYRTGANLLSLDGDYPVCSPDGKSLVYSGENEVVLFNRISGKPLISLPAKYPYMSAFVSEGRLLAYPVADGVALWDLSEEKETYRWAIGNYGGMHLAAAPGRNILAVASLYHDLVLLDIEDGSELPVPGGESLYSLMKYVGFSPDGSMGAFASGNVTVWNVDNGFPIALVSGHTCHPTSAKFTPDGKILLTSSFDDTILLWDLRKVTELYQRGIQ
jgi:WD40 repeat protein